MGEGLIMPTFQYRGQTLTIDTLYSYARVSSSQQTIQAGGEGIPRQLEMHETFANEYGIDTSDLSGLQFIDDGLSGSKGHHLRDGGGLAAFMKLATGNKLKPNSALTVESFSRLSRLPIDLAMGLFLDIIGAGVALITLTDGNVYTRESLRCNHGQMYQVTAGLQAARAMADAAIGYSTNSWRKRRGKPTALAPSWCDKFVNGVEVQGFKGAPTGAKLEVRINPAKHAILQRIFTDILTTGVDKLARNLNQEGVPALANGVWNQASLAALIRGRAVRGEQRVGKYTDGVRSLTGTVIENAYPAVITEDQWLLANAALDGRKKGVANGRNVTKMANLFGDLARCDVCGGRMKIKQKGRVGQFRYLACSKAGVGECDVKGYHRLDRVEARLMQFFETRALGDWSPKPVEDQSATLKAQLAKAQADAAVVQQAYKKALLRSGAMAEQVAAGLEADHAALSDEIKLLERRLVAMLAAKPVDEQIIVVKRLAGVLGGLKGDELISARAKIASALPSILTGGLRFKPDGSFVSKDDYRTIDFRTGEIQWVSVRNHPAPIEATTEPFRVQIGSS